MFINIKFCLVGSLTLPELGNREGGRGGEVREQCGSLEGASSLRSMRQLWAGG